MYDLTSCIDEIKLVIDKKKPHISCKNPLIHGCILGEGVFGTVCYINPKQCNPPIADLNPLALKYIKDKRGINEIEKEVRFLNDLKDVHNVLKIYPINTTSNENKYIHNFDPKNFCIATEYLNGKDLSVYIRDNIRKLYSTLPQKLNYGQFIDHMINQYNPVRSQKYLYELEEGFKNELDYIAQQLILTLKEIHDKKILHLDIKPGNILLDNSTIPPRPVFIDFGLAKTDLKQDEPQDVGTLAYRSDVSTTTRFNDIYALGRTLGELYQFLMYDSKNKEWMSRSLYDTKIIKDLDYRTFFQSFINEEDPDETIRKYDQLVDKIRRNPIECRPNPVTEVNTTAIVSTVKKSRVEKISNYFYKNLIQKKESPIVVKHIVEDEEKDNGKGGKRKKSRRIVKPSIKRRVSRRKKRITRRKRY
tara:strand:- start:323 stop:1576 length:1254 start_codon:yes stop_codon:yes gene_type:complete